MTLQRDLMESNPYPNSDKETKLGWTIEELNEGMEKELDNEWPTERAYPGKFTKHTWPSVTITDREGEICCKKGYFYRFIRCRITQVTAEPSSTAFFIDCDIKLITKLDEGNEFAGEQVWPLRVPARLTFIDCRIPDIIEAKYYFMSFEQQTWLNVFLKVEYCEVQFLMSKRWICDLYVSNVKECKHSKLTIASDVWVSGDPEHTSSFKDLEDVEIYNYGTDMLAHCSNFVKINECKYYGFKKGLNSFGSNESDFSWYKGIVNTSENNYGSSKNKGDNTLDPDSTSDSSSGNNGYNGTNTKDKGWGGLKSDEWLSGTFISDPPIQNAWAEAIPDGVSAEKSVDGFEKSTFTLVQAKLSATNGNYLDGVESKINMVNSELKSTNGYNYRMEDSVIGISGSTHSGDTNELFIAKKCDVSSIDSEFKGNISTNIFDFTDSQLNSIRNTIDNTEDKGIKAVGSKFIGVSNTISSKQDMFTLTDSTIKESLSQITSSAAKTIVSDNCRITLNEVTLDTPTTSLDVKNNSVIYDYKSTLKGELEIKSDTSVLKLDSTIMTGSQKITPINSTVMIYGL